MPRRPNSSLPPSKAVKTKSLTVWKQGKGVFIGAHFANRGLDHQIFYSKCLYLGRGSRGQPDFAAQFTLIARDIPEEMERGIRAFGPDQGGLLKAAYLLN